MKGRIRASQFSSTGGFVTWNLKTLVRTQEFAVQKRFQCYQEAYLVVEIGIREPYVVCFWESEEEVGDPDIRAVELKVSYIKTKNKIKMY